MLYFYDYQPYINLVSVLYITRNYSRDTVKFKFVSQFLLLLFMNMS